jgi:TM2 domain-containing membrane protein YozV
MKSVRLWQQFDLQAHLKIIIFKNYYKRRTEMIKERELWVAYLLWFFLGLIGVHKFYVGKIGMGILYIFTGGIFMIGWLIDLFTLPSQVRKYNRFENTIRRS